MTRKPRIGQTRTASWLPFYLAATAACLSVQDAAAKPADAAVPSADKVQQLARVYREPTNSSPIALTADNKLVWVVNPDQNSVTVIRTDLNQVVAKLKVGAEPRSLAISPSGKHVYVANAAGNSVSVIKVKNSNPDNFSAGLDTKAGKKGLLVTGAEPRSLVITPDGSRVYVANRSQDTITVINARNQRLIGSLDLRKSKCNVGDKERHYQPGALAVSEDGKTLVVTRFISYTTATGVQRDDLGKEGVICSFDIDTRLSAGVGLANAQVTRMLPGETGILDVKGRTTYAFPNQLGSVVLRGTQAYLPNIAASPTGPSQFKTTTQAYVNIIGDIGRRPLDKGFVNLHLGAQDPEPGKSELFFANLSAIDFTTRKGVGHAYVTSAGSDLLVKMNVTATGALEFTTDQDTTRYIDLNDPDAPATSGQNAGKNPLGLVIDDKGKRAYVHNYLSRNVSVVDLESDSVVAVIQAEDLPTPGSKEERLLVGAEMFFSSRGNFISTPGAPGSNRNRLSEKGRQNCASCHTDGLTDGVIWQFATGPRKTLPINATFARNDPTDQRIINASAIFDEVEDADFNTRFVSSPGLLTTPRPCVVTEPFSEIRESTVDPDHGLVLGEWGNFESAACVMTPFIMPNAQRPQPLVALPGSDVQVKAHDALVEWQQASVRTPNRPMTRAELLAAGADGTGGLDEQSVAHGKQLFESAGCSDCHAGPKWTTSKKDFVSPPFLEEIATESGAPGTNQAQYLYRFLKDIGSYNLNVEGEGNAIQGYRLIGGIEKDNNELKALGIDHNGDGKGNGYNVSSILGAFNTPPYYHNGACETLRCVLQDQKHRTAGLRGRPDPLNGEFERTALVNYLESIDSTAQAY